MDEFKESDSNFDNNSIKSASEGNPVNETKEACTFYNETIKGNKKSGTKKTFKRAVLSILLMLCGGTFFGFFLGVLPPIIKNVAIPGIINTFNNGNNIDSSTVSASKNNVKLNNSTDVNNINIIKNISPSIVGITKSVEGKDIFNNTVESTDSGSGIIFHENTNNIFIVTNSHVIENASKVNVSIDGSDVVSAKLVGKDQLSDLAVISISKKDLQNIGVTSITTAELGNSENVAVGDSVIAIGNVLGEGNTATTGIVSAVQKEVNVQGRVLNVFQTDAALNPGSSGGALVNSNGEIIGINTVKVSGTDVEGVNYSIPTNTAKPIIEKIMNSEDSPYLGVYIQSITDEIADYYNIPNTGVIISEVIPKSSASKAGLMKNDIITIFNDQPIFTPEQLTSAVQDCKVGDTVKVKIIRNGVIQEMKVKLQKNTLTSF